MVSDIPPRDLGIRAEGEMSKGECRERLVHLASKVGSFSFESDLLQIPESSDTCFEFGGTDGAASVENEFLYELRLSNRIEHSRDRVRAPIVFVAIADQCEFRRRAAI